MSITVSISYYPKTTILFNAETRNGQDRIVITGIFPSGDEIKAGLLERDWCVDVAGN